MTRLPSGTRERTCSPVVGTRTQPWLTARPNTDGFGQPCRPTVPGPPPKVVSVFEWNPRGMMSGREIAERAFAAVVPDGQDAD
jgi:hypothetical protein